MNRRRKNDRHLPPCVYLKHGAYWLVKQKKWERIGGTLSEALTEYARRMEAPKGGMADLIERAYAYMQVRASKPLSKSTLAQYRQAADRLKEILQEFAPEQVKQGHVVKIKVKLVKTPNMANRILSFLSAVFNLAVEWGEVEQNPCVGVKRYEEAKGDRYLTDAEFFAIRDKAGPRLQVILDLLYFTGQRINDVLAIRRGDITEAGILFRQQKTGAPLCVAWTPELVSAVERAKGLYGNNVAALTLLRARGGKPPEYRTVLLQWHEARKAAGVEDATPHDLRAKAGTDAKKQGHDPQALLGHTSESMTRRYLRGREVPVVSGPSFVRQAPDTAEKG
jgi:integrase